MIGIFLKSNLRSVIAFVAITAFLFVLVIGFQFTKSAQSQNANISLNSPVSFPVDI